MFILVSLSTNNKLPTLNINNLSVSIKSFNCGTHVISYGTVSSYHNTDLLQFIAFSNITHSENGKIIIYVKMKTFPMLSAMKL